MQLNGAGDYRLLEEWVKKHAGATLVYDTDTGLPIAAYYANPIFEHYKGLARFWRLVQQAEEAAA